MQAEQILKLVKYNIVGGSEFLWDIYKDKNLRYMDIGSKDDIEFGSILIDNTGFVYEIQAENHKEGVFYRWQDEKYAKKHTAYAKKLNLKGNTVYDNVVFQEMSIDDIVYFISQEFNENVMPLNLGGVFVEETTSQDQIKKTYTLVLDEDTAYDLKKILEAHDINETQFLANAIQESIDIAVEKISVKPKKFKK